MKGTSSITRVALVLVAIAVLGMAASTAQAQQTGAGLRLMPPVVPTEPRLGFYGHMEYGFGMMVDQVLWGTPASRVGLEPGDVIVRINHRRIRTDHDYYQALATSGPYCRLLVRDVRGRGLIAVTAYLGAGQGPILYRSQDP